MRNHGFTRPGVSGQGNNLFKGIRPVWLGIWILTVAIAAVSIKAAPSFDTSNPESFFTNVAARLLSSELKVDLARIEIYPTNQYTPSVHRLLQVTANIYDATTTNFYPSVFRPVFTNDGANLFICGYQRVGPFSTPPTLSDYGSPPSTQLPLSQAVDASYLADQPVGIYSNNVYGVPWIIGAKKYMPGLNQFSVVNSAHFTRRLQVERPYFGGPLSTNQMYSIGITNSVGISFWNSYNGDYPTNYPGSLNLTIYVSQKVQLRLTNSAWGTGTTGGWLYTTNFFFFPTVWPGSHWYPSEVNGNPAPNSFITNDWANVVVPDMIYKINRATFSTTNDIDPWETNATTLEPLPQFGLIMTNWLQTIIVDNTNVIDYVQLRGPIEGTNLTAALSDPDYEDATGTRYLWSTNKYASGSVSWGILNQIDISRRNDAPPTSAQWKNPNVIIPGIANTISASRVFFGAISQPGSIYQYITDNGTLSYYTNYELAVQAPYTAVRTIFSPYLYQVNDPLVHYLASDLDAGRAGVWAGGNTLANGVWAQDDGLVAVPLPIPPGYLLTAKSRYQPWGKAAPSVLQSGLYNFSGAVTNLIYKDPLVWGPDYWNFPTGQPWSLSWIGQVHRGTPWQTVYLKAHDVLTDPVIPGLVSAGTNTWMVWDGLTNIQDAQWTCPVADRRLVSDLAALLNTNDLAAQFSVNNADARAWAARLDGLMVLTNISFESHFSVVPPVYDILFISSNSTSAGQIVNALQSTRSGAPNQLFNNIGDVLKAPELTEQSPYLNWNNLGQQEYGISDEAYEAIPSQLLPLLRADSIGAMISSNGPTQVRFSGYDGHAYAIEVSSNLENWTSISTNSAVNESFNFTIPTIGNSTPQFYRSKLLP